MASVPTTLNEKRKCKTPQGQCVRSSSSGSLVKFAAMRRASSRVSRFGRRAVRRSNMSEIGGEAEVRGLRLKRRC
jgi:hypothetical protein